MENNLVMPEYYNPIQYRPQHAMEYVAPYPFLGFYKVFYASEDGLAIPEGSGFPQAGNLASLSRSALLHAKYVRVEGIIDGVVWENLDPDELARFHNRTFINGDGLLPSLKWRDICEMCWNYSGQE